ncbi:MAG: putative signal transducing protein [Planctomycetota bacterium]|jgi:hypothetical protein
MMVIATYPNAPKAHVDRLRLEGEGVHAVVVDENMPTLRPLWVHAFGGVKLCVAEGDRERAKEIIYAERASKRPFCPNCESTDLRIGLRWAWLTLITGIPIGPAKRRIVCRSCAHAWRGE